MFENNLKIALRNLVKNRAVSFINIFGLALGITAVIIIWQYVHLEKSYDRFHTKANRIYRLSMDYYRHGQLSKQDAANSAPAGPALKADYPEVVDYVRFTPEYGRSVFQVGDKQFEEQRIFYTDSSLFNVFDFPLIAGDPYNCLKTPWSVVLTRSLAERYFGPMTEWTSSPVGKTIRLNNRHNLTVTAILQDVPQNSHIKFNALFSFSSYQQENGGPGDNWYMNDFYTYVLLKEGADPKQFAAKMPAFLKRHGGEGFENGSYQAIHVQPLTDIHLHSHKSYEAEPNGNATTVNVLLLIGIAIMVIAWVNHINLSTARAEERAKEVGVRKVIGAGRQALISQFLTETFMVNLLAVLLAGVLMIVSMPGINALIGKQFSASFTGSVHWWIILAILIPGTLLSGLYPAFFLSAFAPVQTIKGLHRMAGKGWLRKSLVVFQYTVSVILIIGTLIIYRQLNFMKTHDLGFNIHQKLVINAPGVLQNDSVFTARYQNFKTEMLRYPGVQVVAASSAIPGNKYYDLDSWGGIRLAGTDKYNDAAFNAYRADDSYAEAYGMKIIAGRDFSDKMSTDKNAVLINETALRLLGLQKPGDAIGRIVNMQGHMKPIIGVLKDYHHKSLRHLVEPLILLNSNRDIRYFSVRFSTGNQAAVKQLISYTQQTWKKIYPENPFNYSFPEEQFNEQYRADSRLNIIVSLFSLLAILIACLGLFGLVAYTVSKRIKEIGIRKVLGAGVPGLVALISRDFIKLVTLAILIASPVAWYLMHRWLENFAYRIPIPWWAFPAAGIIAITIALITIGFRAIRAALMNPVKSLRTE